MASFFERVFGPRAPTVNVIRFGGTIQASTSPNRKVINLERYLRPLERAFLAKNVKAVALDINSPGGSAAQCNLIWKRIQQLKKKSGVPVIAFVEDVAASGGYFLACSADTIVADENSIVGSIGVVASSFGLQDAIAKLGIERRTHTAGESKSMLDPFVPEKERDVKLLHEALGDIHENFIQVVETSRKDRLRNPKEDELYSGRIWTAKRAKEIGLIDEIGDRYSYCQQNFGEDIKFRIFRPLGTGLFDLPFAASASNPFGANEMIENNLLGLTSSLLTHKYKL
uniref:Peptidase S49 domain-containing protein n=1 Tax=Aplanochytrium stocchinoi TaxID=215587 RepID=A0A7S3PGJ9_9STRA|mmetsp:Transcript_12861/g.15989  ORF Transcript_12861/g.15989 Transcript_12861/m.15989 type:complete len:284 (-) Transcript_12861:222-1073(-)